MVHKPDQIFLSNTDSSADPAARELLFPDQFVDGIVANAQELCGLADRQHIGIVFESHLFCRPGNRLSVFD
jgi:hypothetical protein